MTAARPDTDPEPRADSTDGRKDAPMSQETEGARPGEKAAARPEAGGGDSERRMERGIALRAGFYIFGTHLFAGFVWLLFYVGEHAHK
ncbi:DUF6126 family protein [Streptomyces griseoaurantiacus]|uniref:Uncharacterized protein n=2 Tax=Streptomyces griseoaurantiacus TaxID=68213 RepID=F3NN84_9ACTN|nr:hypothetical protein SGM_4598 [Streptomyces griseoaurantiacus M045]